MLFNKVVAAAGVCRDFVNSLKPEEEAIVEVYSSRNPALECQKQ